MNRLILIIILATILCGCKKEDPPACDTVREAPPEFLNYFYFPEGSYWVYKLRDSNPAEYDTLRCYGANKGYQRPGHSAHGMTPCTYYYNTYSYHSNSTYFPGVSPSQGREIIFARDVSDSGFWIAQFSTQAGNNPSPGDLLFYPFQVGQSGGVDGPVAASMGTITTPIQSFPNTVTFQTRFYSPTDSSGGYYGSYLRRAYFAPGVGIVRTDYAENRTWELVNYYINN